ncbi:GIY-YIG nuclease family protein [Streptomyces sp. NPDC059680]|uniref:GIY-YIG nuclease family protein n=1 Tax=Streptomyces sp. NPDC059680 TaxID=3346904 RepID=UPI003698C7A4
MTICVIDDCTNEGKTVELGQIPGSPSMTLCSDHSWDLFWAGREKSRKLAAAISEANPDMQHTPGWTYVIRLANGNVKIGMTNQPKMKRLKNLSGKGNQNVPVQVLALIKGGESLEAVLQNRWGHLRVQGAMEEFHPDPSLLEWASGQGIDPAVSDFDDYVIEKHERSSRRGTVGEYAREMFGDINQQMIQQNAANELDSWS